MLPDERDREITRFGERIGLTIGARGSLAAVVYRRGFRR
jgi:hypothetical protein